MKGRPPKSTSLKVLHGNAGKRAKSDLEGNEPAPPSGAPEPPAHLDKRAQHKWFERVTIMMQVHGWLTLFDGDVLAAYCSAYSQWQEAEEEIPGIRQKMRTARGKKAGQLLNALNQMLGQRKQAMKDMKTFGQEIGWSSASRTRIRVPNGQLNLEGLGGGGPDKPTDPLAHAREQLNSA